MNPPSNRNRRPEQPFIMAVASLALLLSVSLAASAQTTAKAAPDSIADASEPTPVVLSFTNADGSSNTAAAGQVAKIRVGNRDVMQFQRDAPAQGSITFTAPANLSGPQQVQLLDSADKPVAPAVQLTYPAGGGGSNASGDASGKTNENANTGSVRVETRRDKVADYNWFYLIVTVIYLLLLVPFGYTIVRAIRSSSETNNTPLGLPIGSFRAILAYTLVVYLGFYVLVSILTVSDFEPPDFLLGIVATVIGFYFGSRTGEEAGAEAKPGSVQGTVTKADNSPAPQATVVLSQAGAEKGKATTDASGKYKIDNVAPGDYDIAATLAGTQPSDPAKVKVTAGATQTQDLKLK